MPKKGDKVYKRKDGLWEARYVKEIDAFGKKKYGSVYARTCSEAKDKRQAALDNILLIGASCGPRGITVERLCREWLSLNANRIKPSSLRRYESFFKKHIEAQIGGYTALSCTTIALHEYAVERLDSGLSPATVNGLLTFLHSCFKYGHRQYHLPMPDFVYFPKERVEMRVLSREEQLRLERYLVRDMDIYKFGVLLTLYTGLRVGELCALRWCDVERGSLHVRGTMQRLSKDGTSGSEVVVGTPKTKTSARTIPLPSFLGEYIEHFRRESRSDGFVLGTIGREVVEPRIMQYKFKKYLDDVGIEGATFHTLRHSFATRCVDRYNFEIKTLSEILGHSSIEMTLNKYVHSSMDLKKTNMERLCLLS